MTYPKTQNPGSGHNLNQKQAQQQNGPAEVVPEKYKQGKSAEERNEDVAEAEVEDFFRLDQQRTKNPNAPESPSED